MNNGHDVEINTYAVPLLNAIGTNVGRCPMWVNSASTTSLPVYFLYPV